ncbi:MAG: phosphotransferase family protein, partial [Steroidobacteraceae bacterium]
TDLEIGPALARSQLSRWNRLDEEFARLEERDARIGTSREDRQEPSLGALDARLLRLQERIARTIGTPLLQELANPTTQIAKWFSSSARAALDLIESYESQLSFAPAAAQQTSAMSAERIQADLSTYLQRRFPELSEQPIKALRIMPGGRSKRTVIFELEHNPVLPSRLVLRSDLVAGQMGTSVADEYPLLTRLHAAGLPVPQPLLLETDPSILNGMFMIVNEIENAEIAGEPFGEERRLRPQGSHMGPDFGHQVAQFLARLHAVPIAPGAVVNPHEEIRQLYEQWRTIEPMPRSIGLELGFAWLLSHPLSEDRPRALVHGDFGCHNILTRGGELVAVLDWELAGEADPAADFGDSKRMLLDALLPWDQFVQHYVAAGGDPRACDLHAVRYYSMRRFVKHGATTALLRHYFLTGARDDILAAGASWHYFHRLQQYCARELMDALDAGAPDNEPDLRR